MPVLVPVLLFAAHDIEASVQLAAPTVVVRAAYAGTEPVAFAHIQVQSPKDPGKDYQAGNMDKFGVFAFVPNAPGQWTVIVDDEIGHRKEVAVAVPDPFTGASVAAQTGASRLERALLGLAILFGATGLWYGFKRR